MLNGFVLSVAKADPPRILAVQAMYTGNRTTLRQDAVVVSADRLDEVEEHPAVLVTTTVDMPNTDVRQLSNSMRTMITDANTQQMLPAGNTNSMVLTGFAADIASLARLLKSVDAASIGTRPKVVLERIKLAHAPAEVAAEPASRICAPTPAGPAPEAPVPTVPSIAADVRTNSVLIAAHPDAMDFIRRAVALIDVEQ